MDEMTNPGVKVSDFLGGTLLLTSAGLFLAYNYQAGFYGAFALTPEQVGLGVASSLVKASVGVGQFGFFVATGTIVSLVVARLIPPRVSGVPLRTLFPMSRFKSGVADATRLFVLLTAFTAAVWLIDFSWTRVWPRGYVYRTPFPSGLRDLYPLLGLALIAGLVGIYRWSDQSAAPWGPTGQRRFKAAMGSVLAILVTCLLGYSVNAWSYDVGLWVQKCQPSEFVVMTGRTPPVAQVVWLHDAKSSPFFQPDDFCKSMDLGAAPRPANAVRLLSLGENGGRYFLYGVITKRLYVVQATDVSIQLFPKAP